MNPYILCQVNGLSTEMLIDSGADINTLSTDTWFKMMKAWDEDKIELRELEWGNSTRPLKAYAASTPLQVEASFMATFQVQGTEKKTEARVYAIQGAEKSLLGRETATLLGVLRLGLNVFSCEQGLSTSEAFPKVPGVLVHFDIDDTVVPTKNSYYHIPAAFRKPVRERLEEMKKKGIIEEVKKAPRWISGMSLVPKGKDDFRLVVNMRGPNRAIKRAFHPLPTIEEIRVRLTGATVFTKLDIKNAFHHLELDEESRELTVFQTETGMHQFTRLVFGVNCAPEIFQRAMEAILAGIEGIVVFIDDILIFSKDNESMEQRTESVLSKLRENNLTINKEKCEFSQTRVKFLGHQLSSNGFEIDEEKIRDVLSFSAPENPTDLRSYLGLATYLADYIENFADLVNPMWEVLKKQPFQWSSEANRAFESSKTRIAKCTTTLGFFSETDRTIVYTDASPHALGAVLVQENEKGARIICFASKTLTATEKAYPQVQKEALGIVWAVERLYFYLMGREFTIRTDARGLSFIFDSDKTSCKRALNRADGWALRLSCYNYKIEWITGKENLADPSSRLCKTTVPFEAKEYEPGLICQVTVSPTRPFGAVSLEQIRAASREDRELVKLYHAVENDVWDADMAKFGKIRDELTTSDDMILRAGAAVIPESLRPKILALAHEGHPGMTAMKSILKDRVWWPRMMTEVEEFVKSCEKCAITGNPEKPVPMQMTELPQEPWSKLAIDFNGPHSVCGGKSIAVLVDYYSRFLTAEFVKTTDFASLEPVLERTFGLLGNPRSIRSDNGPPFNGHEWEVFCKHRNIVTEYSTPANPQQNGLVERYMQLVNKAITIAVASGTRCEEALAKAVAAHNAAQQRTTGMAPEVLLFGRRRRGQIPEIATKHIEIDENEVRDRDRSNKHKSKQREDEKRRARPPAVAIGDEVYVKRHLKGKDETRFNNERFTVIGGTRGDFMLEGSSGRILQRNITQLKKAPPASGEQANDKDDPREMILVKETEKGQRKRSKPAYLSDYVCELTTKPEETLKL